MQPPTFLPPPLLPSSLSTPIYSPPKSLTPPFQQTPLETLDDLRQRTETLKCPFWRRRFTDILDTARQALIWTLKSRHKSLPLPQLSPFPSTPKTPHLSLENCLQIIEEDFRKRQYYVSGRLSASIYTDDCFFDGPDPDMPVIGLAKYVSATGGLFEKRLSRVDLLHIWAEGKVIKARWRLQGALKLPWRPTIKPYVGETLYEFDDKGLVCSHVERWSVSAVDAFVSVVWKGFGRKPAPDVEELMREGKGEKELNAKVGLLDRSD